MQPFHNRRWASVSKFFGSDTRKQTPNLEIKICFNLQLLALDCVILKHASELNKLVLLMWPRLQRWLHGDSMLLLDYQ